MHSYNRFCYTHRSFCKLQSWWLATCSRQAMLTLAIILPLRVLYCYGVIISDDEEQEERKSITKSLLRICFCDRDTPPPPHEQKVCYAGRASSIRGVLEQRGQAASLLPFGIIGRLSADVKRCCKDCSWEGTLVVEDSGGAALRTNREAKNATIDCPIRCCHLNI